MSIRAYLKITAATVILLNVTGCANMALPEPETVVAGKTWVLAGKIAVKNDSTQEGETGYIRWQQVASSYDIQVMGTLGLGAKRLVGNTHQATLLDSSGNTLTAGSPEELMQKNFGWSLPVAAFQDWAQGKAYPHSPSKSHKNASGQVESLSQFGWQVTFTNYDATGPGFITLVKPPLRIKLLVSERKSY